MLQLSGSLALTPNCRIFGMKAAEMRSGTELWMIFANECEANQALHLTAAVLAVILVSHLHLPPRQVSIGVRP